MFVVVIIIDSLRGLMMMIRTDWCAQKQTQRVVGGGGEDVEVKVQKVALVLLLAR